MAAYNQRNSNNTVCVTKRVSVYPKSLNPTKVISLSNLDRQCPMLMYLVFFYKNHSLSLDYVFNSLKSGLEKTLSVWYPAAGRLSLNPTDGKLNLWCNNEGAIMVEAITRVKISELGDLSNYNDFFEDLVYKPVFNRSFSDMPLVVAQVTKFGCGGYSIGIGTSHSLFDGPSTYDFLSAWACNSAILKQKQKQQVQVGGGHEVILQKRPVHERGTLLLVGNDCGAQKGVVGVKRAAAIDHLYELIKQALTDHQSPPAGTHHHMMKLGGSSNDYVLKTYHLSGAMIDKLKLESSGDHRRGISSSCSSFEIVAAHLWKARTKALGVKKEKMVCLQFAVDIRNKMAPPLPKGFSGNAYVLASIMLTAGELEQQRHEGIIEKIKEAKNGVSNEYVKAYIKALDGPQQQQGSLPPMKELTIVSDWTRMSFHKIDFLSGEEAAAAAYASPLVSPIPQVAYLMQSVDDLRGIHLRIGLHPQSLDAFSHYFLTNLH